MSDVTETDRRDLLDRQRASGPASKAHLEGTFGRVWDTSQLIEDFEVLGFMAPFVVVRRKADGRRGSLTFQHNPRLYFDFVEDAPEGAAP